MEAIDAQIKAMEQRLWEQAVKSDQRFEEMLRVVQSLKDSMNRFPVAAEGGSKPLSYSSKLDFPKFDGSNSRLWIKKCCKYFVLCKIPDEQKVDLASLNMIDKAEIWVGSYLANRSYVDWNDFVIDVNARFKDEKGVNVVEEFNKLQQSGTIESYVDNFEELKSVLLQIGYNLPDQYLLESFVGGRESLFYPDCETS
ncbi:hypothetical protein RDABS01_022845 [Bienertia sinuspersici]